MKIRITLLSLLFGINWVSAQELWLEFIPTTELDNGQSIVLISGDESYRSEESLPMLAKILTHHHGFRTRVLFPINPTTLRVDPNYLENIPGLEALESADLVIIQTRFRELPDEQMKHLDKYLNDGKPIIGLRTATHAFRYSEESESAYKHYGFNSKVRWIGGFGKEILGETWVSHHGLGDEGTKSLIDGLVDMEDSPILNGVGVIDAPSGVYTTERFSDDQTKILLWGASTKKEGDQYIPLWEKSIMPIAWTKIYTMNHNIGKVFTTTLGASVDFVDEDLRKLVVNAVYWCLDKSQQIPEDGSKVDVVGDYKPTMWGFDKFKANLKPENLD